MLAQLAALAVKDGARDAVAAFAAVERVSRASRKCQRGRY
jgi:hypothetical protein